MATDPSWPSLARAGDSASDFSAIAATVRSMMRKINVATACRVVKVHPGALGPTGRVDITPLVNQLDGNDGAVPHGTIFEVPYVRLQGGANAIVIDPEEGDFGFALFADRDISAALATRGQANPGSFRRFDMSDAIYLPAWSGVTPAQYVQFAASGILVHSPTKVTLQAPAVEISAGSLTINVTGAVEINSATLKHNGTNVGATHHHADPQGGTVGDPF